MIKLSSQFDKSNQLYKELNKNLTYQLLTIFKLESCTLAEIIQKNTKKRLLN